MNPNDPRHGTEAGHEQHIRDGEPPCPACIDGDLKASRRRAKRKAMGHIYTRQLGHKLHTKLQNHREAGATFEDIARWAGISESQVWRLLDAGPTGKVYARTWLALANMQPTPTLTTIGATRRVRALMTLGYSKIRLAEETGVHADTIRNIARNPDFAALRVREAIAEAYERLSMTPAVGRTQQERAGVTRAINTAKRNGWEPPLSWESIDDPNAKAVGIPRGTPSDNYGAGGEQSYDHAVVERVVAGEPRPRKLTNAEATEVVRRLRASGMSTTQLEALGFRTDRYFRVNPRDAA